MNCVDGLVGGKRECLEGPGATHIFMECRVLRHTCSYIHVVIVLMGYYSERKNIRLLLTVGDGHY